MAAGITTVLHAVRKIEGLSSTDKSLAQDLRIPQAAADGDLNRQKSDSRLGQQIRKRGLRPSPSAESPLLQPKLRWPRLARSDASRQSEQGRLQKIASGCVHQAIYCGNRCAFRFAMIHDEAPVRGSRHESKGLFPFQFGNRRAEIRGLVKGVQFALVGENNVDRAAANESRANSSR